MKGVIIIALLCFLPAALAGNETNVSHSNASNYTVPHVIITEILPNPTGPDEGNEFIEIFSADELNYSLLTVGDAYSNDTLFLVNDMGSGYVVIMGSGSVASLNCTMLSTDESIGNGLSNEGDRVMIWYDGILLDEVRYDSSTEGISWNRLNDTFVHASPNPCAEYLPESPGQDCASGLVINLSRQFFDEDESIKYFPYYQNGKAEFNYWVEDYFGNTVKEAITTDRYSERSYTPRPSKTSIYRLKARSADGSCEDEETEILVAVVVEEEEVGIESGIDYALDFEYDDLCDDRNAVLTLDATRDNGQKKQILASFYQDGKRISQVYKLNIETKNSKVSLSTPIHLDALDCTRDEFELKIEGLGFSESSSFAFESRLPEVKEMAQPLAPSKAIDRVYTLAKKLSDEPVVLRIKLIEDAVGTIYVSRPIKTIPISNPGTVEIPLNLTEHDQTIIVSISGIVNQTELYRFNLEDARKPAIKAENATVSVLARQVELSNTSLIAITGAVSGSESFTNNSGKAMKYAPYAVLALLGALVGLVMGRR